MLFNFYDVKGLLIFFIWNNDLVFFFENLKLYWLMKVDILDEVYIVLLDKVNVVCEGIDIFLIVYSV